MIFLAESLCNSPCWSNSCQSSSVILQLSLQSFLNICAILLANLKQCFLQTSNLSLKKNPFLNILQSSQSVNSSRACEYSIFFKIVSICVVSSNTLLERRNSRSLRGWIHQQSYPSLFLSSNPGVRMRMEFNALLVLIPPDGPPLGISSSCFHVLNACQSAERLYQTLLSREY